MFAIRPLALLLLLVALFSYACLGFAQDTDPAPSNTTFIGDPRFPAPAFPEGLDWLNVPAPLTPEVLRGKVVIFDFWTYGCINCIHMIPVLERIEGLYPDEVVVISVHSAKFTNESALENLRQIVQRYGLDHPVVNDEDFRFWDAYGAYAWPTFVVVDPRGNIGAMQAGEIPFESFNAYIGGMVETFRALGELNTSPLRLSLVGEGQPASALAFPGKVLADSAGERLFIADSQHHRLVVADLTTYEVRTIIGAGSAGFADGSFAEARFNTPQGMVLVGEILYVADSENHAIRAVDLAGQTVRTLAGTGERSFARDFAGVPAETALASPWDLAYGDRVLYIAMAGMHQIWALDLVGDHIAPVVGSGREGLLEGMFTAASLAQPSGLAYDEDILYFADAESSSIRAADLRVETTRTLAGPYIDDLFTFGDVDGAVGESRLQHPLGVALGEGTVLYVADTYNSKIKQIDLTTNTITTLAGGGSPGAFRDGDFASAAFDEPSGISYAQGLLYVADANNHAIRVLDLAARTVTTIQFPNAAALQIDERVTVVAGNRGQNAPIVLPEAVLAPGVSDIVLRVLLPEGYKINPLAPSSVTWAAEGSALAIDPGLLVQPVTEPETRLAATVGEGSGTLSGELLLYYCREVDATLCYIERVTLVLSVRADAAGAATAALEHTLVVPGVSS